MRNVFAVALVLSLGCGGDDDAAGPGLPDFDESSATVSYSRNVLPIFQAKCIACHHAKGALKDWNLSMPFDAEQGIIDQENMFHDSKFKGLVVPGKPAESFLLYKVTATKLDKDVDGDVMPYVQPEITADDIENVRKWIDDGAENDQFFKDNVAPIFGTRLSIGDGRGKCGWCHSANSPYSPNLIDPFDSTRGVFKTNTVVKGDAKASLLFRKIGGAPLQEGEGAPMPMVYEHLTGAELKVIETWIKEGALNN